MSLRTGEAVQLLLCLQVGGGEGAVAGGCQHAVAVCSHLHPPQRLLGQDAVQGAALASIPDQQAIRACEHQQHLNAAQPTQPAHVTSNAAAQPPTLQATCCEQAAVRSTGVATYQQGQPGERAPNDTATLPSEVAARSTTRL